MCPSHPSQQEMPLRLNPVSAHRGQRGFPTILALGTCLTMLTVGMACKPPVKPDAPVTTQQPGTSETTPSTGSAADTGSASSQPSSDGKPAAEQDPKPENKPSTSAEKPAESPAETAVASKPTGTDHAGTTAPPTTPPTPVAEPDEGGGIDLGGSKEEVFSRAVAAFEKGPSGYKDAVAGFKSVLNSDDKNYQAHFNLGVLYMRQEKLSDAEREFKRVTDLNPKFNGGWSQLADVYRLQKDAGRAMSVVESGLKEIPGDALLLNNKALILREQGKTQEAIEEIRKILKVNAIDVNAFNNMGRTYLELKDYDMAQFIFLKALQTAPGAEKDPWIHNNLGLVYMGLKDPRAASEFDRALEIKGDLLEALVCRAFIHLTVQEFQKAAEQLEKAVQLDPENITIRLNYGMALRGLKKYPEAEVQYTTALRIDPKNTSLLLNLGILLGDYMKDYYRALEVYKQLRDASPSGPELEKAEKLVKEMQRIIDRMEKKKKEKAAKPEPPPENKPPEGGTPEGGTAPEGGASGGGAATPAGGEPPK